MLDRAMQTLYKLGLDPIAETTGDPNSYGVRRERSPADAIAQCFQCFRQKTSPTAIYEGDIRGCFDTISHEWMLENIPIEKRILKQWLKAGYIDRRVFYHTDDGTPQGGPISPVLANMTLDGLEATVASQPHQGTKRQAKLHLIRFADDFVITGSSKALLGEDIEPGVVDFMAERGLGLSAEKTKLTDIEERLRLPGPKRSQVQRQAPDQTLQTERQGISGESPGSHQGQSTHFSRATNRSAQPCHTRMG